MRAKKPIKVTKIDISPNYVYEVSSYLIYKDRVECIDSKIHQSNKPIDNTTKFKYFSDHISAKYIDLFSAPEDYLLTNNYIPNYANV